MLALISALPAFLRWCARAAAFGWSGRAVLRRLVGSLRGRLGGFGGPASIIELEHLAGGTPKRPPGGGDGDGARPMSDGTYRDARPQKPCVARGVSAQPTPRSGSGGAHGAARTRDALSMSLPTERVARAPAGTRDGGCSRIPERSEGPRACRHPRWGLNRSRTGPIRLARAASAGTTPPREQSRTRQREASDSRPRSPGCAPCVAWRGGFVPPRNSDPPRSPSGRGFVPP
jgi:hypothetical protein